MDAGDERTQSAAGAVGMPLSWAGSTAAADCTLSAGFSTMASAPFEMKVAACGSWGRVVVREYDFQHDVRRAVLPVFPDARRNVLDEPVLVPRHARAGVDLILRHRGYRHPGEHKRQSQRLRKSPPRDNALLTIDDCV